MTPVYNRESALCLVFLIPLSWTFANRQGKNVSRAHGLYAGRLMRGGKKKIISHLSCLWDKAVCLTSHINNVMGSNLPDL